MSFQAYPKALRHPETGDVKIIKNAAEEGPWLDRGYVEPGKADPAAFLHAQDQGTAEPVHEEWPKYVDGKVINDPSAPVPPPKGEYPKWINGRRVASEDEELDLLEEDEEMAMPAFERAEERAKLMAEATELGLRVDGRWGIERLRATVRGHTVNHHHSADA